MKVIKLNGRHNLFHRGFKYAFLFTDYQPGTPNCYHVERLVKQAEGMGTFYNNTFYGKRKEYMGRTPFYVGFNKESTVTIVQLQI